MGHAVGSGTLTWSKPGEQLATGGTEITGTNGLKLINGTVATTFDMHSPPMRLDSIDRGSSSRAWFARFALDPAISLASFFTIRPVLANGMMLLEREKLPGTGTMCFYRDGTSPPDTGDECILSWHNRAGSTTWSSKVLYAADPQDSSKGNKADQPSLGTKDDSAEGVRFALTSFSKTQQYRRVRGTVSNNLDLADDQTAKRIIRSAAEWAKQAQPVTIGYNHLIICLAYEGNEKCDVFFQNDIPDSVSFVPTGFGAYTNYAAAESVRVRLRRSEEEKSRKRQLEQQAAVEAQLREAHDLLAAFKAKNGVDELVSASALARNPFTYQARTVATLVKLSEMDTPTTGLFSSGVASVFVSAIQKSASESGRQVLLAGRVLGKTPDGWTHLRFVGVHVCTLVACSEFGPELELAP